MDKELLEQFQMLTGMMATMATKDDVKAMETRINIKIENMETGIADITAEMANMATGIAKNKHEILKTQIMIENEVSNKISALFDGYKLTHEKQFELERKVESLEQRVFALESRIA